MRAPRLKLSPPDPTEDELHASVARALTLLLLPPAMFTTMPMGGYALTAAAAARLYRLGARRGWPDVLVVHQGRLYGIELKTPTGTLTDSQKTMFPRLRAAGVPVVICRSLPEVLDHLRGWDIPLRRIA